MKKRVFLIHGWGGYPEEAWRPWLKERLEQNGFQVAVPAFPNTDNPNRKEWVAYLHKVIGIPDEHCYFVGHSLGAITIIRYLESLQEGERVGGVVFVAGFDEDLGIKELRDSTFFATPIAWEKVRNRIKGCTAIFSDNDPYVSLRFGEVFKEKLNAEIVELHNMHHFSGDDGVMELPIALEKVLEIAK
jgi:predicted alpha/beta hydrolase family esterase